jgi:hypothetical protein
MALSTSVFLHVSFCSCRYTCACFCLSPPSLSSHSVPFSHSVFPFSSVCFPTRRPPSQSKLSFQMFYTPKDARHKDRANSPNGSTPASAHPTPSTKPLLTHHLSRRTNHHERARATVYSPAPQTTPERRNFRMSQCSEIVQEAELPPVKSRLPPTRGEAPR